ncbi:MAG TPA: ATP-binding cassette domain-containing protein [Desulfosalsimonadaceae bacterium]|nr:ATP-binding cassette domain-containing protein [Desulfosalsimonadaceae bacterium]
MIHVDNLTKFYDGFCAVDGISLDIQKGEILGLLGPNGAGKTTTLKMLTGYFPPTSGTIAIKDLNINDHLLEIKQMIGYLPESSPFYKDLLVYDYLDYVAKVRGINTSERHTRIKYLAELCGLNHVMHKSIGELSKGLNQRVGLAHAMMRDPEILILDEPTQGLDPNQIVEIRKIIRKIGEEKTVIFSTHILSEAEATCDRIVIINRGQIVADGETEDLKQSAGRESTIQLTLENAAFDTVSQTLKPIDGVESVEKIEQTDGGRVSVKVACRSESDRREDIYKAIKNTDWVLLEFYQETKTLETIFSDLTRQINKDLT